MSNVSRLGVMTNQELPIILIFGPSGTGKSSVGARGAQMFKFLHLETDRFPGDGFNLLAIRPEWEAFWLNCDALPLAQVVGGRARTSGHQGAIVTFPSRAVPSPAQLAAATSVGMTPVVLHGKRSECLNSFLARENSTGRGLGADHWLLNNAAEHSAFDESRFEPFRVRVFEDGAFRDPSEILQEVRARAG